MLSMTGAVFLLLTIVGKLLALAKEIVLAGLFGVGHQTDSYFIANQVPSILWLAFYTTIGSVFMPAYVRRLSEGGDAAHLAREAVRYYGYLAGALMIFSFVFAAQLVALVAPHAAAQTRDLATQLCRILSAGFVLTGYVGIQSAIQQAHRQFATPLLVPVINNLLAMIAVIIAWYANNIAIAALGAVAAYLVQAVIQRWQTWRFYRPSWGWGVSRNTWYRLSLLSAPMILAVTLDQFNTFIGVFFASQFGNGAISHLNYASRLAVFIAGLFSWLVSYLFFPAIAAHAAADDDTGNAAVITRALAIILVTTTPVAAAALALRQQIVEFIYGRGSFTAEDVQVSATMFGFFGLGIIFTCLRDPLNRIFFSYQRTAAPLAIGIAAGVMNITSTYLLIPRLGISAIPIGASMAALVFCAAQLMVIARWKPALLTRRLGIYFASSVGAGIAAYLVIQGSLRTFTGLPLIASLAFNGVVTLAVYAVGMLVLLRCMGLSYHGMADELRGVVRVDGRLAKQQ
jgi:putative peptidoglycan lipid II flippase